MAAYKPVRIGVDGDTPTVPLRQVDPASETLDAKIQVSATNKVLGRTSAGAGGHEEIDISSLGGGGGITDITYADMETALAGSTLTKGGFYNITDAAGTDLGFVTQAVETNAISVSGVGGYLNADFQGDGDYSGTPETFNAQLGIWRVGFEAFTIDYTNLSGGTFAVGDTVTGAVTGAQAVILSDDGASSMTAYSNGSGFIFDGSEQLDNGGGVTADMDGAASSPTIVQGDVVIWNLLHYQVTDDASFNGDNPENNTDAYTLLDKATYPETYVTAWDISEFDFPNAEILFRGDSRKNQIRGADAVASFTWGNDDIYGNNIIYGQIDIQNTPVSIYDNSIQSGAYIGGISATSGEISSNFLGPGCYVSDIETGDNLYISGNFITGASGIFGISAVSGLEIGTNTIGNEGYIGNNCIANAGLQIYSNIVYGTIADNCTFGTDVQVNQNTLYKGSSIILSSFGDSSILENNILENGAQLTGITAGANCSISRNRIGQGATLGGSTTMGDGAAITDNTLANGYSLDTITLSAAETIANLNYGQVTAIDEATRDALIAPAAGLFILNTDTSKLNFYTGAGWEEITSA